MSTWTDLTFAALSVLTATKMTQLDANFDALAEAASGSPQWRNRFPPRDVAGSDTFVVATDCVILWTPNGGTLTLPAGNTFTPGQPVIVIKDSGASTGTIAFTGGDTCRGDASIPVTLENETIYLLAKTGGFNRIF